MVCLRTKKENALWDCAFMILRDECPPDREHYLCMKQEEACGCDCFRCWDHYLRGIGGETIEFPRKPAHM